MTQGTQVKEDTSEPQEDEDPFQKLDPYRVMSIIPLIPYQVIVDVGCGTGKFTIPLGKYVFNGRVHALDSDKASLDAIAEQCKQIRLSNIDFGELKNDKLPLDDNSADGVFAAFSLHKASNTNDILSDVFRCLRKGGWFAVLEWQRKRTKDGPSVRDRLDEPKLIEAAKKIGFRLTSRHDMNDQHYMVVMRK
ncbi:MAG: class I SAM-dependent methyltransferase [Chloroflexi bacterium]|nr:class I SAM-dependent methyltransferase [Chloroflexota bacterium]